MVEFWLNVIPAFGLLWWLSSPNNFINRFTAKQKDKWEKKTITHQSKMASLAFEVVEFMMTDFKSRFNRPIDYQRLKELTESPLGFTFTPVADGVIISYFEDGLRIETRKYPLEDFTF